MFGLFKLTQRQKAVISLVRENNGAVSASTLAKIAENKLNIPLSSYWFALRDLRKLRLVEFGNGKPVRLTKAGEIVAEALSGVKWWERK